MKTPLPHFSRERFPENFLPNRWSRVLQEARERAKASGEAILDLAVSNPTAAGFLHERNALASALSAGTIERYSPSPRGNAEARRAIADFYKTTHGAEISPEKIHLTASTSEAYSWLAKLFCDAGDNVIAPAPSYPLIDNLCALESVETRRYFSFFDEKNSRWALDFSSLENAIDARTRAIFCVCPNNPTGAVFNAEEREKLLAIARERRLPLVADEVFLEYGNANSEPLKTFAEATDAPVFVLGGLSKSAALPQIKVGWILTCGDEDFSSAAALRLDFVADAFLSSSAPAQCAVPALLASSAEMRARIGERIKANENALAAWCKNSPHGVSLLPREAGWTGILRLPRGVEEESLAIDLLRRENVLAHPGYFYDLESVPAGHLVVSLIAPTEAFASAFPRIERALMRN